MSVKVFYDSDTAALYLWFHHAQELDFHRKYPSGDPDDRFVPAVEDFAIHAAIKVRETDMLLKEMKEQFQKALHFFGEDPTTTTTDKFMGIFLTFFKSFEVSCCYYQLHTTVISQPRSLHSCLPWTGSTRTHYCTEETKG